MRRGPGKLCPGTPKVAAEGEGLSSLAVPSGTAGWSRTLQGFILPGSVMMKCTPLSPLEPGNGGGVGVRPAEKSPAFPHPEKGDSVAES